MTIKTNIISLSEFPEEEKTVGDIGVKVYGETSYENQMAVLSHWLHNHRSETSKEEQTEIAEAIREFLERKECHQELIVNEMTDYELLSAAEDPAQYGLFSEFFDIPFPTPQNPKFTFIDLFAGVGGIRLGMQEAGGKCIYSSEWNSQAQKTYLTNYGEMPFGDITKESTKSYIPDSFDVLCAGFPCQPFSISGKQKGFEDTRGTLFFDICSIVSIKRPKVIFLENVKHLVHHDDGNTLKTILAKLDELGYNVKWRVLNGSDYGVPQNRERIIIVGCLNGEFDFDKVKKKPRTHLIDFLDKKHKTDRYYLLTTANMDAADWDAIDIEVARISQIHGCQVIVNGVYSTLKYYLRLMSDPSEFIDKYVELMKKDETIKYQHKETWNDLVSKGVR